MITGKLKSQDNQAYITISGQLPDAAGNFENVVTTDETTYTTEEQTQARINIDAAGTLDLALKADKATTYTKNEVDAEIDNRLVGVYRFKGSVATVADLPAVGEQVGDIYKVIENGLSYAWEGEVWDNLGPDIDLTAYALTETVNTQVLDLQTQISTNNTNTLAALSTLSEDIEDKAATTYVDSQLALKANIELFWTGTQLEYDALTTEQKEALLIAMIEE